MSIFVTVEDKEGEQLAKVLEIESIQKRFAKGDGVCLRFVGEAVDSSFNVRQIPFLAKELEGLSSLPLTSGEREELGAILAFCAKFGAKVDAHIRFYGEGRD